MQKTPEIPVQTPVRTYAGQEHGSRVAQRRERFIEAGVEQFGTLGYHATTVRTLTAAAGLSNRYFYESFATMEDLLIACFEQVTTDYRERLRKAVLAAPNVLEARMRAGVRCFFEEMRDPRFARITQVEVVGVSSQVDAIYVKSMRDFGGFIMENIVTLLPLQSTATKRELELIGVALTGAMTTAGGMWVRSRYRDSIDVVSEATVKILLGTAQQLVQSH
jgi:AcrR family transcriptional regulator